MKISLLSPFFLILICCDNQEQHVRSNYIHALKNNVEWSGSAEIHLDSDTLTIWGIANEPDSEVILMRIRFDGPGEYVLTGDQAYYYATIGGDVIVSNYKIHPNTAGKINISKYDKNKIEGSFEIILKQEWSNPPDSIEVLNFKNGLFSAKISP